MINGKYYVGVHKTSNIEDGYLGSGTALSNAINKTESKVRCTHKASGATAYSDTHRSQHQNKRDAFVKMVNTKEFKKWHRLEIMKRMGVITQIEDYVEKELRLNTKTEVRVDGIWTAVDKLED